MVTKHDIRQLIKIALATLSNPALDDIDIQVERAKDATHGDFASNIALMLAKKLGKNPRQIAQHLVVAMPEHDAIEQVSVAGPGFINFKVSLASLQQVVKEVLDQDRPFGNSTIGAGTRVHMEFVSANPTGPLHVGHGRSAAYGASVVNLLRASGFDVHAEYYVNDAGRQMRILALSTWLRYLALHGEVIVFPEGIYQGDYIIDIAGLFRDQEGDAFLKPYADFASKLDSINSDNKDEFIDHQVLTMIELLGEAAFDEIKQFTLEYILADIKDDLSEFGVEYNQWFKESVLFDQGLLQQGLDLLTDHGYTFKKEGALWFEATKLGDEKDRVLVRENGQPTYFASDVAYHLYKYNQGYDSIIDVFGADHHGYIGRIRAFLEGLGKDPALLNILLVQFAILYRGNEKVSMSTRGGDFVTLRQLREEVGNDAARFFYIMRKPEQHLDFDLELAKAQSNDNPVYYIQYAHARIHSVFAQLEKLDLTFDLKNGLIQLGMLKSEHEQEVMRLLSRYPEVVELSAVQYEPHRLAHFLQELANCFHSYYNATKMLVEDDNVRHARLCLVRACADMIAHGLGLLGVAAPTHM